MAVQDIRYRRLGYLALSVTNLERSEAFYRDLVGVATQRSADGASVFLRVSDRHHDLVLTQGAQGALRRIGWEMESPAALAAVRDHLSGLGLTIHDVEEAETAILGIGPAFRVTEPTTGAAFEFYASMESAPPFEPTHTNIARLGHVVLGSPRKAETERFLSEELNFRISDRIGDVVTFMRCFPNPLHHSFGVGGGQLAQLAPLNFLFTDIDDIGRPNNRMKKNGVKIAYGPGRHPTSESIFFYFVDPDGLTVEYSFGMEEFSEEHPRAERIFPVVPESFDIWGGTPEPEFHQLSPVELAK